MQFKHEIVPVVKRQRISQNICNEKTRGKRISETK